MSVPMFRLDARRLLIGALLALVAGVALLPGCGGGVGTGGTGSFASGPITGFGSVIVNDIRFDDSAATIRDGDGNARASADLKIGMTVEIQGDAVVNAAATARSIRVDSELLGPVDAVQAAAGRFVMLGQTVAVDVTTAFDDSLGGGVAGLAPGMSLQVFAVYDAATSTYRATRVEPAPPAQPWHLRGPVAEVSMAAQTLRIGGTSYPYGGAGGQPASLGVGQYVRLTLGAAGVAGGGLQATAFGTALPPLADADGVKLRGIVSAYTSRDRFEVNGREVDATNAFFPTGVAALALGARVEVEGTPRGGTLVASQVTVVSEQQDRQREFQLIGAISAVNAGAGTFELRGQTVGTGRPDLRYRNGAAKDLKAGAKVSVKGVLSPDGRRVDATEIEFI